MYQGKAEAERRLNLLPPAKLSLQGLQVKYFKRVKAKLWQSRLGKTQNVPYSFLF